MSGLDGFKEALEDYGKLAVWAVPSAIVPFGAHLLSLSPPWPSSMPALTSIVELLALIFVYQHANGLPKRNVSNIMKLSLAYLFFFLIVYLFGISIFTFEVPPSGDRYIKGFQCTNDALLVFPNACPWLGVAELKTVEYEASRLWTGSSIAAVRIGLVIGWIITFFSLAAFVGSFIVYQRKRSPQPRYRGANTKVR